MNLYLEFNFKSKPKISSCYANDIFGCVNFFFKFIFTDIILSKGKPAIKFTQNIFWKLYFHLFYFINLNLVRCFVLTQFCFSNSYFHNFAGFPQKHFKSGQNNSFNIHYWKFHQLNSITC